MPLINFPDVPFATGVPNVPRLISGVGARLGIDQALQKFDMFGLTNAALGNQWGILDDNGEVVIKPYCK